MSVLVVGATGNVGPYVVSELTALGESPRVLVRDAVRARTVTLDQVRASLLDRGMADWEADHFREMYELFKAGESEFVTDTVRQVTGAEPRSIEAFLDEILVRADVSA